MKFLFLMALLALVACNKKKSSDTTTTGTTASEWAAYVGTWVNCSAITGGSHGTDFPNGSSSLRTEIRVATDGAFTIYKHWFNTSTNCTAGNVINYYQTGTLDVTTDNTNISGAKNVEFHSTTSQVTVYDATIRGHFNTNCMLVFTGQSVNDPSHTCTGSANLVTDDFFGPTFISYNAFKVSGTSLTISEPFDWDGGVGGAPTTAAFVLTKQ